jgi:hypothetical protein
MKFPPDFPPEVPPPPRPEPVSVPIPLVYDDSAIPAEYRVLSVASLGAIELEATLNSAGFEGWWLVQVVPRGEQQLLIFVRQRQRKR